MARTHQKGRPWTRREESKLRRLYAKKPLDELARTFRRTIKAIKSRAKVLRITRGKRRPWTHAEDAVLRNLYPRTMTTELSKRLRRPRGQVYQRANRLGISQDPDFKRATAQEFGRRLFASPKFVAQRFSKGHVPENKGLRRRGYSLAHGRMSETTFKKGQLPHTWMPVGSTRLVGCYLYRKVTDIRNVPWTSNWVAEHIRLWEEVNGPLNRHTHTLRFKDGDRTHVSLDNLELITRADNMRRNTIHNLPQPLRQVIQLRGSIRRQITMKTKDRAPKVEVAV